MSAANSSATETVVRTSFEHECTVCRQKMPKGSVAVRRRRHAETHHERLHADGRGMVAWYRHEGCVRRA